MPGYRRFFRLARVTIITILLATGSGVATSAAANAPKITEQRNAAVGFAITLWMVNVDALGNRCSKLGSPSDGQFLDAFKAWQDRNVPYVNAALEYIVDMEDFIAAQQGEAVRRKFHAERKAEFIESTHKIERVWFPNGIIDEASCMRAANHMADGSMDLDRNAEFLPVLQALKVEADKKGAQ